MSKSSVMPWIDLLPNVASTTFQARRNQIGELMLKAAELTRQAEALRSQAYSSGCSLEADAKGNWSIEVIEQAKRCAG